MQDTPIIPAQEADIPTLLKGIKIAKVKRGQKYRKDRNTWEEIKYLDIITAFDIETSKYQFGKETGDWKSWMYIWQWQVGNRATIIGRTWEEYLTLVNSINDYLKTFDEIVRLMVFVHNLSFEFQFISGVWKFDNKDIFATDTRSVLYCLMDRLELRCSYRLSNYSLYQWAKELGTDHFKMLGDLDYKIVRYSDTVLTPEELRYCVNDVICVVECVEKQMQSYGDTLYSIPYTSTGYIRRMVKKALNMWCHGAVRDMQNSLEVYDHLREAFRGGDTHANRHHVNHVLGDVYSYDRSSSYPDVICHCMFPMSRFREELPTKVTFQELLDNGRAVLLKVRYEGIRLRDEETGDPYIPTAKCNRETLAGVVEDNGRILSAAMCEIAMTDVDFEIIQDQYTCEKWEIIWMESARYGYLPRPLIDLVIKLYHDKTAYKGVDGKETVYMHSKALLNSVYGMMCQRVVTNPIVYDHTPDPDENGKHWHPLSDKKFDRVKAYNDAIDKAFLNYAWAVWVTSWARYRLHQGIKLAQEAKTDEMPHAPFVYADTDSVKSLVPLDFTAFNEERIRDAKKSGAWAVDRKGIVHYMGVFEDEGRYDFFGHKGQNAIAPLKAMIWRLRWRVSRRIRAVRN